jgi:hypothetical protein
LPQPHLAGPVSPLHDAIFHERLTRNFAATPVAAILALEFANTRVRKSIEYAVMRSSRRENSRTAVTTYDRKLFLSSGGAGHGG